MPTFKHPKAKLSDSQLVILSSAAGRDDGAALPPPKSLKAKGGAATRVFKSLIKKGLIAETPAKGETPTWRKTEEGDRLTLVITETGLQALGIEPARKAGKPTQEPARRRTNRPRTTARKTAAPKPVAGGSRSRARQGTKQAILIELLKRKGGATIAELRKATGWQAHSVRGAISGTLKKKLGLAVTAEPLKDGSRSYRITGPARITGQTAS